LGYNKDALIGLWPTGQNASAMKVQFEQLTDIRNVTLSNMPPGVESDAVGVFHLKKPGTDRPVKMHMLRTDHNFLNTYQIPLLSGRQFMPQEFSFSTNMYDARTILMNETAAQQLSVKPGDFITAERDENEGIFQVVGIVKDFHNSKSINKGVHHPCRLSQSTRLAHRLLHPGQLSPKLRLSH
jgi:putative ABC transport system permease protein